MFSDEHPVGYTRQPGRFLAEYIHMEGHGDVVVNNYYRSEKINTDICLEQNEHRIYGHTFVKITNTMIKSFTEMKGFEADENLDRWTSANPGGTFVISC
jgi:hypothetical protein